MGNILLASNITAGTQYIYKDNNKKLVWFNSMYRHSNGKSVDIRVKANCINHTHIGSGVASLCVETPDLIKVL